MDIKTKILETLERKKKEYHEINKWFENVNYRSISSYKLVEWEKVATECNAQINLLLFLLSEDNSDK